MSVSRGTCPIGSGRYGSLANYGPILYWLENGQKSDANVRDNAVQASPEMFINNVGLLLGFVLGRKTIEHVRI